jgi:hypothetical protein
LYPKYKKSSYKSIGKSQTTLKKEEPIFELPLEERKFK